jgi:hypothetical protein
VLEPPPRPPPQARRIMVAEARLPELLQRVRALEQRLEKLAARFGEEPGGSAERG